MTPLFVQIGATRDGREGYLVAARRRGMRAVLVETPSHLALRQALGRATFDRTIALDTPGDADDVAAAIQRLDGPVVLILPGFERYTESAHAAAARLRVPCGREGFQPLTKLAQRQALAAHAPEIRQPGFTVVPARRDPDWYRSVRYPAVLKPIDGGGGLGVFRVDTRADLAAAIDHVTRLRNYDNTEFRSLIVEDYLDANEYSVQGLMCDGTPHILGYCSKVIALQPHADAGGLLGFREVAHVLVGPDRVPAATTWFAGRCAAAMQYRDGPFHIDFREAAAGPLFIEMGFRLSGAAITDLVRIVSGCDWADAAFSWMSGEGRLPAIRPRAACAAHVLAFSDAQIDAARRINSINCINKPLTIAIDRFSTVAPRLTADEARLLAPDLSRHAGPIARIRLRGADPDAVRRAASELCVPMLLPQEEYS